MGTNLPAGFFSNKPGPLAGTGLAAMEQDRIAKLELPGALVPESLTILDGSITPTRAAVIVDTEGGAPADDLAAISTTLSDGGTLHEGMEMTIQAKDKSRVITVKNSAAVNGILTADGKDVVLGTDWWLTLYLENGSWKQKRVVGIATKGSLGLVQIGSGLSITSAGLISVSVATPNATGTVKPDGITITIKSDGTISVMPASKYDLCEFYYFRHPTLKPGFQPAQGGLLANAATLYPEAWAYLKTTEGQKLCKTEALWQAMTTTPYYTLADGTKISFDGIGGAPFFAPNLATGALRLPDLRGMYVEAAGSDGFGVGDVHPDAVRNIAGRIGYVPYFTSPSANTIFYTVAPSTLPGHTGQVNSHQINLDISRNLPTAAKNQPRAFGVLACVYLGAPR